jgi:hypothetical protein
MAITKYIPYHKLFQADRSHRWQSDLSGSFDGYANRDSLKYRSALRAWRTSRPWCAARLRKAGYCAAWDVFVQLGCTEDGFSLELPATCELE